MKALNGYIVAPVSRRMTARMRVTNAAFPATSEVAVLDADKLDCGFMAFCYLKMKQHSYENATRIMEAIQHIPEIAECYNISGDYDFLLKIYTRDMKAYQKFLLRILGEIDCIGSLNSSFVLGEVKNEHQLPSPSSIR